MQLRDYQQAALDKSYERLQAGCNRQLIVMATGLGKAVLFAALRQNHNFQKRVMVLVHREELAKQAADKIHKWNPGLMCGTEMASRYAAPMDTMVVASVPTLGRRGSKRIGFFNPDDFDCVVSDECFPAGTLIDGKPIENIVVGDMVMSYDESGRTFSKQKVTRLFKNPAPATMITIRSAGREFTCTANHPIFTDSGWRSAANVRSSDSIVYGVRLKGRHNGATKLAAQQIQKDWTSFLFGALPRFTGATGEFGTDGQDEPQVCLRSNGDEQPDASRGQSAEDAGYVAGDRSQAQGQRRERDRLYFASSTPSGSSWWHDLWMGIGARRQNRTVKGEWLPKRLQAGPSQSCADDRSGDRRLQPQPPVSTGAGQEEGFFPVWTRVDSVEVQEQGSAGKHGDGFVYNLEIENTHTYFANDFLVHNCHHATSPQWKRVLSHFNLMAPSETPILSLGLTATPNRADGVGLRECFDEIIYDKGIDAGIRDGYLVDLRCWRVETTTGLDQVHTVAGDFNQGELADAVNNPKRNATIVKAWSKHAWDKRTLVFTVDVQHALDMAEAFKALGVPAAAVWGEDPERADKLKRMRNGELTVLCNCAVLTEGYDDPGIECIVLAKPTKSALLLTQMIGRGTRLPDGYGNISEVGPENKQVCLILDVADVTGKHQLCSVPSLLGMPKDLDMKGETYKVAKERLERVAQQFPTANLADLKDLSKLDAITKQIELFTVKYPVEIKTLTELAWRQRGDGFWLPGKMNEHLSLARDVRDEWWVRGVIGGKSVEEHAQNLAGCFNMADRIVRELDGDKISFYRRDVSWRKRPPSEKTLELCKRFRIEVPKGATQEEVSARLDAHFAGRRSNEHAPKAPAYRPKAAVDTYQGEY